MALSPMMQQYVITKEKYKDAILLYRLGDFYEMFFEDAVIASKALDLTLTGKMCGLEERAPMCGIPYHALDGYLARLIEQGYKMLRETIINYDKDNKHSSGIQTEYMYDLFDIKFQNQVFLMKCNFET